MKTKENFTTTVTLKILMGLSLIVVLFIGLSSCNRNKNSALPLAEVAPPPPPPPPVAVSDSVYVKVDELPVFAGGDQALLDYIKKNTVYPADAKKNNIQGKVIVKLVVQKDCAVSKVEVLQSVNPQLDAEAIRVVSSLPKFEKPGIKDGRPVSVNYMIPIYFRLN